MRFSMKQHPAVCEEVAYDINNGEEVARLGDLLDSSEEVRHLTSIEARTANSKFY